jgi:putative membrane protein
MMGLRAYGYCQGVLGQGMMGGGGFIGLLCMLIFLVLFVILIMAVIKMFHHGTGPIEKKESLDFSGNALLILNERYARGEISDEEYIRMKAELKKG